MSIASIKRKFKSGNFSFTDNEVNEMLDHIGDPASKIRDDLICNLFGECIMDEYFTDQQYLNLFGRFRDENLLFYKIKESGSATLTRSFSCLLAFLFLQANNNPLAKYYKKIPQKEISDLINSLIKYAHQEHDYTSYDEVYGWVHAIAHLADVYGEIFTDYELDKNTVNQIFNSIKYIFDHCKITMADGEATRLAQAASAAIIEKRWKVRDLLQWLESFNYDQYSNSQAKFHQYCNWREFVLELYVNLDMSQHISETEKRQLFNLVD